MHAYLIVGLQPQRGKKVEELLGKAKIDKTSQFFFDTSTSHSIELIRSIEARLRLKEGKRAVIIENAQRLTTPASFALLKTLEEPPGDTIIILSCENESLPETILSRCLKISVWGKIKEGSQDAAQLFRKITNASIGERVELAESLGRTIQTKDFCREQLLFVRKLLLAPQKNKRELLKLAKLFLWALPLLENNINPKMLLFELVMSYPKLTGA